MLTTGGFFTQLTGAHLMRARTLKPGFFNNEVLCSLPPLARILFEGLWCIADKNGRLEDRPKRIRAEVFPYEDFQALPKCSDSSFFTFDELLDMLEQAGFVQRYITDAGQRLIQIPRFRDHQKPYKDEPDRYPAMVYVAPPKDSPSTTQVLSKDSQSTSPLSCSLIPCSLDPVSPQKVNGHDFEVSGPGLAQSWCFATKNRFNGKPKETEWDAASRFTEMIRVGWSGEELLKEIEKTERDKTETLGEFVFRLKRSKDSKPKETQAEQYDRVAKEMKDSKNGN